MANRGKRSRSTDDSEPPAKRQRSQPSRTAKSALKAVPIKAQRTGKRALRAAVAAVDIAHPTSTTPSTSSSLSERLSSIPNSIAMSVNEFTTIICNPIVRVLREDKKYHSDESRIVDLFQRKFVVPVYGSVYHIYCLACKKTLKSDARGVGIYNSEPYKKHFESQQHTRKVETWRANGGENDQRPLVVLGEKNGKDVGLHVNHEDAPRNVKYQHIATNTRAKTVLLFETGTERSSTYWTMTVSKSENRNGRTVMVEKLFMKTMLARTAENGEPSSMSAVETEVHGVPAGSEVEKTTTLPDHDVEEEPEQVSEQVYDQGEEQAYYQGEDRQEGGHHEEQDNAEAQEEHPNKLVPARFNKTLRLQAQTRMLSHRQARHKAPARFARKTLMQEILQTPVYSLATDPFPSNDVLDDEMTNTDFRSPSLSPFQVSTEDSASETFTTPARDSSVLDLEDESGEQGPQVKMNENQMFVARGASASVNVIDIEEDEEREDDEVMEPWEVEVRTGIDRVVPESFCRTHIV